jgi:hypothetical protein
VGRNQESSIWDSFYLSFEIGIGVFFGPSNPCQGPKRGPGPAFSKQAHWKIVLFSLVLSSLLNLVS